MPTSMSKRKSTRSAAYRPRLVSCTTRCGSRSDRSPEPLEDDRGPRADLAAELGLVALGADRLGIGLDRLEGLELVLATVTDVVVSRHRRDLFGFTPRLSTSPRSAHGVGDRRRRDGCDWLDRSRNRSLPNVDLATISFHSGHEGGAPGRQDRTATFEGRRTRSWIRSKLLISETTVPSGWSGVGLLARTASFAGSGRKGLPSEAIGSTPCLARVASQLPVDHVEPPPVIPETHRSAAAPGGVQGFCQARRAGHARRCRWTT